MTGQDATLDEALTGRQNLVMIGELRRLRRARGAAPGGRAAGPVRARRMRPTAWSRATPAACAAASTWRPAWSPRPPVLFLDEPTTGLDPTSRQRMWGVIRGLVADGVTVLLTTQYLDEADALADRIVVIDHGRVIAEGTPRELKASTGSQLLEVTLAAPHAGAAAALARVRRRARSASPTAASGCGRRRATSSGLAVAALRALDQAGALVDDIAVHQPVARRCVRRTDRRGACRQMTQERSRGRSPGMSAADGLSADGRRTRSLRAPALLVDDVWVITRRNLIHVRRDPSSSPT